jgi:hypothetical protein
MFILRSIEFTEMFQRLSTMHFIWFLWISMFLIFNKKASMSAPLKSFNTLNLYASPFARLRFLAAPWGGWDPKR